MKNKIWLIVTIFILIISLMLPFVFAIDADAYSYELKSLIQKEYDTELFTVKYFHPEGYPNIWVAFKGDAAYSSGTIYIYFYDNETKITAGSTTKFSKEVYAATLTSKEEVEKVLFEGNIVNYNLVTSGVAWSNSLIYNAKTDPSYYKNSSKTLDEYYYDWYYEKNGTYPTIETHEHDYNTNISIIEPTCTTEGKIIYTCSCGDFKEEATGKLDHEYNDADKCIMCGATRVYGWLEPLATFMETLFQGLFHQWGLVLENIQELLGQIGDRLAIPEIGFLNNTELIISQNLANNKFYNSLMDIVAEIDIILNADYKDPAGYYEITPLKISLDKTIIKEPGSGSYTHSGIEWGLDNVQLLNLDWYFGNHSYAPSNGGYINADGSPAAKQISDAVISGFLWFGFGWYLWHSLPDLIGGTLGPAANFTKGVGDRTSREKETKTRDKKTGGKKK